MVGDAVWDVEAAERRDIPTIAFLTGGYSRQELLDSGAAVVYDDPADLLDHLDEALRLATGAEVSPSATRTMGGRGRHR